MKKLLFLSIFISALLCASAQRFNASMSAVSGQDYYGGRLMLTSDNNHVYFSVGVEASAGREQPTLVTPLLMELGTKLFSRESFLRLVLTSGTGLGKDDQGLAAFAEAGGGIQLWIVGLIVTNRAYASGLTGRNGWWGRITLNLKR